MTKHAERTKRRAMVVVGTNCSRIGDVSHINDDERTCRITFEDGSYELKFWDDIEFVDEFDGSEFGGFTDDEASLLEALLG